MIGPAAEAGQKALESVGGKIGEDTWNKAKEVWNKLKPWADKKPDVASTLKDVSDGDILAKDALARDLKRLLESMPDETVKEIRNIIKTKNEFRVIKADHGGVAIGRDAIGSTINTSYYSSYDKKSE